MRCEEQSLILVSSIKDHNNMARLARHILECNEQDCEALIQLSLRQDQLNLFLSPIFPFHFISYPADLRQWFCEARFQLNQEMLPAEEKSSTIVFMFSYSFISQIQFTLHCNQQLHLPS